MVSKFPFWDAMVIKKSIIETPNRMTIKPPILITGCSHSGTTLIKEILGRNPSIHKIIGESSLFVRLKNNRIDSLPISAYSRIIKRTNELNHFTLESDKLRWMEKTPNHVFYLKEMLSFFIDVRIIVIVRDGRDVITSMLERGVVTGYDNCFEGALNKWRDTILYSLQYAQDPRILFIRYEDLVTNPEIVVSKVNKFINEDFSVHSLIHYNGNGEVVKPKKGKKDHAKWRKWQAAQPIFKDTGNWKHKLARIDKKYFKKIAGNLLIPLGYEKNDSW